MVVRISTVRGGWRVGFGGQYVLWVRDYVENKVLMFYLDGYSYQQIGEKINKDAKSVDNAIQRIKKKIENIVKE